MTHSPGTDRGRLLDDAELHRLQQVSFSYFWHEVNETNGLVADRAEDCTVCSIAGVGLALSLYPVAVERKFIDRRAAVIRTLNTLRFFADSEQSADPQATGYRGLYFHYLEMQTGRRARQCELSTIDTALLMAGILTVAEYFTGSDKDEYEIRELAAILYGRADWAWTLDGRSAISQGWKPEDGFMESQWHGYCEALILYLLALGSPTYPIPPSCYEAWTAKYEWRSEYGHEYLYAGPLFIHQLSHVWIDFRGIRDGFMRKRGIDYFENSRRATYVQQRYAIDNPKHFREYHEWSWGLTACHGPDKQTLTVDGIERRFLGYAARGAPDGPDDGTLAPWAVAASLPFAPEIVLPTLANFVDVHLDVKDPYGFKGSFNPTFTNDQSEGQGWVSRHHYGLNQGPLALMIENYRSGFLWRTMRKCLPVIQGLRQAGFRGGWL